MDGQGLRMCRFTRDGIPELGEYLESVDGIMRKEDGPIRHKENGAVRLRCPCRESNPVPLGNCERRGVPCTGRARPEDRTRRCSVIHHWASPDACSAPAVTAFLRRRATAMATPFQSSVADSTLVSEQ